MESFKTVFLAQKLYLLRTRQYQVIPGDNKQYQLKPDKVWTHHLR